MRKFEWVDDSFAKHDPNNRTKLPERATRFSAGYDFYSHERITIAPGEQYTFWTDVKAEMPHDEFLFVCIRSSLGIKKGLELANQAGIIDADYYENKDNDGNIGICLRNTNIDTDIVIDYYDRIAQGIFMKYSVTDDDQTFYEREGGIGST